jgi:hypothetical protein
VASSSNLHHVLRLVNDLPEAKAEGNQHYKLSVRRKTFAWYVHDHHGDGREALHCRAAKGENEALVAADPDRFFLPPHLASKGFVGLYLDTEYVGWEEVRELLTDAYRLAAPKKLVVLLPD